MVQCEQSGIAFLEYMALQSIEFVGGSISANCRASIVMFTVLRNGRASILMMFMVLRMAELSMCVRVRVSENGSASVWMFRARDFCSGVLQGVMIFFLTSNSFCHNSPQWRNVGKAALYFSRCWAWQSFRFCWGSVFLECSSFGFDVYGMIFCWVRHGAKIFLLWKNVLNGAMWVYPTLYISRYLEW